MNQPYAPANAVTQNAWDVAVDSGGRYAGAVVDAFKFWKWPQALADMGGGHLASAIYSPKEYFNPTSEANISYLKQQFGTAEGYGSLLGSSLLISAGPSASSIKLPQITTADGYLFGKIQVTTPFDIPVQRFGKMNLDRLDFWGLRIGQSETANRVLAAIKPEWNPLTNYTTGVIPRGTPITFGLIAPQGFPYLGGSIQFTIESSQVVNQNSMYIFRKN